MDELNIELTRPQNDQTVIVDLFDTNRNTEPLGKKWSLKVTPAKEQKYIGIFKKKFNRLVNLSIDNIIDNSGYLEIKRDRLVSLVVDGNETYMKSYTRLEMLLNDDNNELDVILHPKAIIDCYELQGRIPKDYALSFDLIVSDSKTGQVLASRRFSVSLSFVQHTRAPEVMIRLNPVSLTYNNRMGNEKIGEILLRNVSEYHNEPALECDCEFTVSRDGKNLNNMMFALDYEGANVQPQRGKVENFIVPSLGTRFMRPPTSNVTIPIIADIKALGNPYDAPDQRAVYHLRLRVNYHNKGNSSIVDQKSAAAQFAILANTDQPILCVETLDPKLTDPKPMAVKDGAIITMSQLDFLPGANEEVFYPITFSNAARSGRKGSGVYIRNLKYEVIYPPMTKVTYATRNNTEPFELVDDPQQLSLITGVSPEEKVMLKFNGNALRELYVKEGSRRNYNVTVTIRVSFNYCLDERGDSMIGQNFERSKVPFSFSIEVPVYQHPNPNWLAIDFGTSAIVTQYGNKQLNLHAVKDEIFGPVEAEADTNEEGTPFLSSNLILRSIKGGSIDASVSQLSTDDDHASDFHNLAVCLSPTTNIEKSNQQQVIPCLKLIVGYDMLPNIENYNNFSYNYFNEETGQVVNSGLQIVEDVNGLDEKVNTPLASVDKVFEEVYNELFSYYISKAITKEARNINQIILTIPNTYTPEHIRRIEQIVRNALKDINIRRIRFVSESDAVASFYQRHWAEINTSLGRVDNEELKNRENVLVYDMGAGTLDITLFSKINENGKRYVKVLGKIGIAKAGNYLDCLLANILAKKIESLKIYADPQEINTPDRFIQAADLKNYVKNIIKPQLSSDKTVIEIAENKNWKIKRPININIRQDILKDPDFEKYVSDCTITLIENFFRFFVRDPNIKIDTVLMSGRSTKLRPIQVALKNSLAKWGNPKMEVVEVSSLTEKGSMFDRAKVVVTEGAIDYATLFGADDSSVEFESDNITACYGIIYEDINGESQYIELLNPRTALPESISKFEGMIIKEYRTPDVVVDLGQTETLKFVQTYSADTLKQWRSGDREYITLMSEINVLHLNPRKDARVHIEVDHNNAMRLIINGSSRKPTSSSKVDINSKSNRYSLWPMLITGK